MAMGSRKIEKSNTLYNIAEAFCKLNMLCCCSQQEGRGVGDSQAAPGGRKGRPTDPTELAAHEAKKAADKAKRTREYEDPDNIWGTFGMGNDDLSGDDLVKSKVLAPLQCRSIRPLCSSLLVMLSVMCFPWTHLNALQMEHHGLCRVSLRFVAHAI